MLKKFSLIFIKFIPFLLVLNVLTRIILEHYLTTIVITYTSLICEKILIIIGLIILSYTFKFCVYHQILLYYIVVQHLVYLYYSILGIDIFVSGAIDFISFMFIITIFVIIYFYIKQQKNKNKKHQK